MTRLGPFLAVSALIHFCVAMGIEHCMPVSQHEPGIATQSDANVFVTVLSRQAITAEAVNPAAQSSASSQPVTPVEKQEKARPEESTEKPVPEDNSKMQEDLSQEQAQDNPADESSATHSVLAVNSQQTEIIPNPEEAEPKQSEQVRDSETPDVPDPVAEKQEEPEEQTENETSDNSSLQVNPTLASHAQTASAQSSFNATAKRDLIRFRDRIIDAVQRATYYPRTAFRKKQFGEVLVSFAVSRDGSLQGLKIVESSKSELLDQAAVRIMEKAAKEFPSIPQTCSKENIRYVLPIIFKKRR
jgi:protein TonB